MVNWYNLFNKTDFLETGLVSRKLTVTLTDIGEKEILITNGNTLAILYEGIFLPVDFLENNPFVKEGHAVFKDSNDDIWLGVEVAE